MGLGQGRECDAELLQVQTRIHPLWCIVIGALLGLAGWV